MCICKENKRIPICRCFSVFLTRANKFFEFNWQIGDEWFGWCKQLSKEDVVVELADYVTLEKVKSLSDRFRIELDELLKTNLEDLNEKVVCIAWAEV